MHDQPAIAAFSGLVDLASARFGGEALLCSDDFFASMDNLVRPEPPEFDPDAYTDRGKLMDGWESRRKRVPGHDWCILRLGLPGRVRGLDVDTSFFLGNHPPFASLYGCNAPADTAPEALRDEVEWVPLLPEAPLRRGSHNLFSVQDDRIFTHLRLDIHPDGGVARLRVYGEPAPRPVAEGELMDLAALVNGGRALACSDMFFSPMENLIAPGRAHHMGQGWETRRSRPPGSDWIILELGRPGELDRVTLDTRWFKGNYPDRAAVDALRWPGAPAPALVQSEHWQEIIPETPLRADQEHDLPVTDRGPWTHLRLRICPDGGVSRLRAWGCPVAGGEGAETQDDRVAHLNGLPTDEARDALTRCCGSRRWVDAMLARRPFASRTHLMGEAEVQWWRLGDGDWKEAFTHHPRIGADVEKLREKFATTADWSAGEQAGVQGAAEETLQALAQGNREYEERFGFIFIVCATGLTADEMLRRLRARLDNAPWAELRIAAGEQAKITQLRLEKLLG